MIQEMIQKFDTTFQHEEVPQVFFAPYQMNIMGDHTDYNKGLVLPVALSFGTYAVVHKRDDTKIRLVSTVHQDKDVECELTKLTYQPTHHWANYPKGIIYQMVKAGLPINTGFDILYSSDIPNSPSLSSTASIEMVTAVLLNELFHLHIDRLTLIKFCNKAENNYIGFNNGMMNKMAIGFGRKDHALLIDCATNKMDHIPILEDKYCFLMVDTNKPKELSDNEYIERRNECERSLLALQSYLSVNHLGELTMETFANAKQLIKDPVLKKRVKHIVSENERTKQATAFIKSNDMESLGKILIASQNSLQINYDTGGYEVQRLIKIAMEQTGVLGGRIASGGFGGCIIVLIEKDYLLSIQKRIYDQYYLETGAEPHFYPVSISDGAKEVTEGGYKRYIAK